MLMELGACVRVYVFFEIDIEIEIINL